MQEGANIHEMSVQKWMIFRNGKMVGTGLDFMCIEQDSRSDRVELYSSTMKQELR